ncbi:MAG: tRNA A-37 threonylcarbamoyl transferase component Bud32 [Planctomycetota bacterium]|jgi:tRNA A-37 threonylcarbamoyl transferase component Bud32
MNIPRPNEGRVPVDFLGAPSDQELEQLASWSPPALLRRGPGRETFAWIDSKGVPRIVKRFSVGPGLEGWRERLRGAEVRGPAQREFAQLVELAGFGLPVPAAIAWHLSSSEPGISLVVMEQVVHEENLRQLLQRRPEDADRWLAELLELVTTFHRGGWYHRDLYLDHVLVERLADGRERLVLIDLGRARRERRPRRRWLIKDLAALWHSTSSGVRRTLALRFLTSWMRDQGILNKREKRRILLAVIAKERRMAAHTPRGGTSFPTMEESR